MGLDGTTLKEILIEAWKSRANETTFSASLSPLIAQCQSDDEFRTLFTSDIDPFDFFFIVHSLDI